MENRPLVGVMLIAGFIMAVSAASLYAQSHILAGTFCGCPLPLEYLIPLLSSAGLLVGSLAVYFMSSHLKSKKDMTPVLALLDYDERRVIEELVKGKGSALQSRLVSATGFNKVRISRLISDLESKGAVKKSAIGMTNTVELEDGLRKLLVG